MGLETELKERAVVCIMLWKYVGFRKPWSCRKKKLSYVLEHVSIKMEADVDRPSNIKWEKWEI